MNLDEFKQLERIYPPHLNATESPAVIGIALYGLARLAAPKKICEFGCYHGNTTAWLVRAAIENEVGRVFAYDNDQDALRWCIARVETYCGTHAPVSYACQDLNAEHFKIECDFAFVDHEPKEQYGHVLNRLDMPENGIVAFHDLTFGPAVQALNALFSSMERSNQWDLLRLPWARGLIVARKR